MLVVHLKTSLYELVYMLNMLSKRWPMATLGGIGTVQVTRMSVISECHG